MYAKCGSLVEARKLLNKMPQQNAVSWTAVISGYAQNGRLDRALELFQRTPQPNVVSWTSLISGCVQVEQYNVALKLFREMQLTSVKPNLITLASVLSACVKLGYLEYGKQVHEDLVRSGSQSDLFVGNGLIEMYAKCGSIEDARKLFDKMPSRNIVSFNIMISAYRGHGYDQEALRMFYQMQGLDIEPDEFTFSSLLPACANLGDLELGMNIHERVIRNGFYCNVFVGCALIDMYVKCRKTEYARQVFDKMPGRNVVTWNVMSAGYAENGKFDEALKLFEQMQAEGVKPNLLSWSVLIKIYAENGNVNTALEIFQNMPERNVVAWTAMVVGFAQNGKVNEALELFKIMPEKNVVSWTAMISGCAQNGCFVESVRVFQQMQATDVEPNSVTFASVLPACANLAALPHGKEIHEQIIRRGLQCDVLVGNALVDMYAKCGSLDNARKVFDKMCTRNLISWNAMIVGCAMHWCGMEALHLFEQLRNSGIQPDHVTFVGVLSACCHAGLFDAGWQYFYSMSKDYGMVPQVQHYGCMVELLGRAGRVEEAHDFIKKMPVEPDSAVWRSLLSACRINNKTDLGEHLVECLIHLEPENSAHYVLLSNMYTASGRWNDAENVQKLMKDRQVKKMPGRSWIEVNNKVFIFHSGDMSHPQSRKIYKKLETLSGQMKEAGYVPDTNFVLHDVEEEQKENVIFHHSEKLALAFGLISMSPGERTIRVIKNLRACGDCHSFIKFISKMVMQEIVLRDANRFHHFKDGQCSCQDYW